MIQRALLVGLGSIGKRHLRLLRAALPEADIRVLRHSGCSGAIEHADGCYETIEEACGFAPQLSIIANPAPFHLSVAEELAKAGSHLLIEKPLAHEVGEAAKLVDYCQAQGLVCHVGYNLRFLTSLQVFRAAILEAKVGKIHSVRAEIGQYLPDWRPGADYRSAVSAKRELGGGVLLELSHEIDMLRWVFGAFDWVSAWVGRVGNLDIDVEDSALLNFKFASGVVGQLAMDFIRRDPVRRCTAFGEDGSLRWDAIAGTVEIYDTEKQNWERMHHSSAGRDDSYISQIDDLLRAIETQNASNIAASAMDGVQVLEFINAARQSHELGGKRIGRSDEGQIQ